MSSRRFANSSDSAVARACEKFQRARVMVFMLHPSAPCLLVGLHSYE